MTYAFIVEWMDVDDRKAFDRRLSTSPERAKQQDAMDGARNLMQMFGMAAG